MTDQDVAARRLSRTEGTRLKFDYVALVQVEARYLHDGQVTAREREDLNDRLYALDTRVGDVGYGGVVQSPRTRLDAIIRALPSSGLSAAKRSGGRRARIRFPLVESTQVLGAVLTL